MIARFHYDQATYQRFLDNELPPQEVGEIETHVEACSACQDTLESLSHDEAWGELPELLGSQQSTVHDEFAECDAAIDFLKESSESDSLGRFGRYEIVEVLGRGGMGIVLKGFDKALNRYSAIKVLAPHLASSGAARRRFAREAKSAAAVVHEHVVPIHTVDEEQGLPYLVMPVIDGQSLQQRISRDGPLEVREVLRIGVQIAKGLAAAHEQGLVHRDVKPANVLLENGVERVMLTDFGLARAADDANMTQSGSLAGTPEYMSPEQARGADIDSRSDIFSLGSVLYFMCTGHAPFRAATTMGVLHRITSDSQRSLCSVNEEIPAWLDAIVGKLLEKDPSDRFQTASDVATLLADWLAHLQQPDVAAKPKTLPRPKTVSSSRGDFGRRSYSRLLAVLGGFALLAGFIISLEMNKGTLTIQCDADDVPVRIMKADKLYRSLQIDRGVTSTRISAGEYVVELDAKVEGLTVKDGVIELTRQGAALVSVTESKPRSTSRDHAVTELAAPRQGVSPEEIRESAVNAERSGHAGRVQIEFMEESDVFVVRGKKENVERVMSMIDELKDNPTTADGVANRSAEIRFPDLNGSPGAYSKDLTESLPWPVNEGPVNEGPVNEGPVNNNLAVVAGGLRKYAEAFGRYPGTSITARVVVSPQASFIDDTKTRPYSWRVAILPFIGHADLYERYRFDEPWDSPANTKFASEMPAVYGILGPHSDPNNTAILGFAGARAGMGVADGVAISAFRDGTSNTALAVLAATSVPWTKPEDLNVDINAASPPEALRSGSQVDEQGKLYLLFADGALRTMQPVGWSDLKAAITRDGREHRHGLTKVEVPPQPATQNEPQSDSEDSRSNQASNVEPAQRRLRGIWWDRERKTVLCFGAAKQVVVGVDSGATNAGPPQGWSVFSEPVWWKLQPQGSTDKIGLDFYDRDDAFLGQAMLQFKSTDVMVLQFEDFDENSGLAPARFPGSKTYILVRKTAGPLYADDIAKLRSGEVALSDVFNIIGN